MSETWKMPTWMREVCFGCFGWEPNKIKEIEIETEETACEAVDIPRTEFAKTVRAVLSALRAAELLFTPGENDMHARAYDQACKDITRLRTENADLLENYKRADRGLRECCDSKERIRAENKKMQGFIEIVASCAGWQKDEGGNYMESNGVCPNCQDEARKILKALGGDHD